jgi:hypothetical protein
MALKAELNIEIGDLRREYKPLEGRDANATLIMALLRKLAFRVRVISLQELARTPIAPVPKRTEFQRPKGTLRFMRVRLSRTLRFMRVRLSTQHNG